MLSPLGLRIHVYCHNCDNKLFDADPNYISSLHSSICEKCKKANYNSTWKEERRIDKPNDLKFMFP